MPNSTFEVCRLELSGSTVTVCWMPLLPLGVVRKVAMAETEAKRYGSRLGYGEEGPAV